MQLIALASRPAQCQRLQRRAGLRGVVAAVVDRLAHFGQRIGQRLAAFLHQSGAELGQLILQQGGRPVQHGAALRQRGGGPARLRSVQILHRLPGCGDRHGLHDGLRVGPPGFDRLADAALLDGAAQIESQGIEPGRAMQLTRRRQSRPG